MKIGDEVYVHGYIDEIRNDVIIIRNEGGYFGTVPSEVIEKEETLQNLTKPNKSDLISRQAAIEAICEDGTMFERQGQYSITMVERKQRDTDILDALPSAQPFTEEQIQTMQELESAQLEKAYELGKADRPTDEEDQLKFYYVESLDDYWVGRRLDNFYYATWHGRFGFIWSHSKYLPWGEHIVDENTLWKEHTYPSEPKEIPFTEWIVGFVKKYFADRPTGHWIETALEYYEMINEKGGGVDENTPYFVDDIACSECLAKFSVIDNETERFDFCPNCGSYNGGDTDGSN